MSDTLHWAREVYRLLVATDEAMSVSEVSRKLGLPERTAREAVSVCRLLAAQHAHAQLGRRVVGFDPQLGGYADAKSAEQSARIMRHLHSRAAELLEQLSAMADAHLERFGQSEAVMSVQQSLFDDKRLKERMRWP